MSMSTPLTTEWVSCDLCGASEWETLFVGRDRRYGVPGEFGVTRCRYCGHLQTNPRPTREALPAYYPETYESHDATCHRVRHTYRDLALLRIKGVLGWLFRPFGALRFRRLVPVWVEGGNRRMLEIGCGTGWLCGLAAFFGWRPVGVDISLRACQQTCRLWGVTSLCHDGAFLPFRDNTFQLVVLRHTLEHLPSPRTTLQEVFRVLQPGGWVAIEVPNAASLGCQVFGARWDSWDLPRHLHHFTPQTLQRLLEQVGFANLRIGSAQWKPFVLTTHWLPRRPGVGFLRGLLGAPAWLLFPWVLARRQGEVLRAWGRKPETGK
ncbi:MAG: hypothetical protein C4295_01770 [Candidatus Fervidibacterota bacterium]